MAKTLQNRIRKIAGSALVISLCFIAGIAQDPTKWTLELDGGVANYKSSEVISAQLRATIEPGWHLYSLDQPKGGPIPTTIRSADPANYKLISVKEAAKPIKQFDPNFKIETEFFKDKAEFVVSLKAIEEIPKNSVGLDVRFQLCNDSLCLPPKTLRVSTAGAVKLGRDGKPLASETPKNREASYVKFGGQNPNDQPIWGFIWLAVSLGALSLLTPCVFPMIPITVSYFTKNSGGDRKKSVKLALVYSFGIIATFTLLGMLLAVFVGAAGINLFAANPWINLLIAAIFLVFAGNLFGAYEINPPSGIVNKLDRLTRTKEGQGSAYLGALLMGLTFTVTSFTCTSPFVGTLLVSTSQGNWAMPLLGMIIFSAVFALPFFVLALAPQLVSQMPRAGGWLNSVKVVMGFLEIAAALKFLSNVDLVWSSAFQKNETAVNYGTIFTREVVLILWVLIALAIVLYLLGYIRFRFDSELKRISPIRALLAVLFFVLAGYLTLGVFGKRLGELESFLPPKNPNSWFNKIGDSASQLSWIENDFESGLKKAKAENKRVFVDFTGYTCTNCRWMETNMFVRTDVRNELNDYVLVSLYTDGDGEIYERQQQFQEETFQTVALPFYAVFDADGNPVSTFPGLTRNPADFIDFLRNSK